MNNLDRQKEIIDSIRQCQRNWDLSRDIPQEHLDHLVYFFINEIKSLILLDFIKIRQYNTYCSLKIKLAMTRSSIG